MNTLINEIAKAEELLSGKPFRKEYFFNAYCVIIKYFIGLGLSQQEARLKIIEWEEKFGYKRYFDINSVILTFYEDNVVARGAFTINISEQDIFEIKSRFDKTNERKIAFAMLCYAKAVADKNGCFYISYAELYEWIGIAHTHIQSRYLKYLIKFGYIEKIQSKKSPFTWNRDKNKNYYKKSKFKILVDFSNDVEPKWVLEDNDINKLFAEIFSN